MDISNSQNNRDENNQNREEDLLNGELDQEYFTDDLSN